jgi:hypothetical protein
MSGCSASENRFVAVFAVDRSFAWLAGAKGMKPLRGLIFMA